MRGMRDGGLRVRAAGCRVQDVTLANAKILSKCIQLYTCARAAIGSPSVLYTGPNVVSLLENK